MEVNVRSWLWLVLLLVPLAIGLAWGACFDAGAYVTLRYARDLAAGRGLLPQVIEGQALLRSPLYALALWLLAELGVPLPLAGLILSALGWGATAAAIYAAGRAMGRPAAALVAAALAACSPALVAVLGTEAPWAAALGWVGIGAGAKGQWRVQSGALALMLLVHFDWVTLALTALLLTARWAERRRFPLQAALLLAIGALGWELLALGRIVAPYSPLYLGLTGWARAARRLLHESELYWFFLPPLVLGLLALGRKAVWAGLLWVGIALLSGGAAAEAMMFTLGLFLAGWGVGQLVELLAARSLFRLRRVELMMGVMFVVGLPLGAAQTSSLWQRYQFRPLARRELEREAGDWLRVHSEPAATLFGSERVGYLAERASIPWDGGGGGEGELAKLLVTLTQDSPDYVVSCETIGWHYVRRTGWFRSGYEPLQEFDSAYDVTSPLTIWGRRASVFDELERRPLDARLPGGVNLIGCQYWPEHIQPGESVRVTLFLQATRPVTESFRPIVQMSVPQDAGDWMHWRQVDLDGDCSVPLAWWQAGQVVADRFVVQTAPDTPVGAYRLDVSMLAPDGETFLPIYRGGDASPLDRALLGYVAVPWEGEMGAAQPVDTSFGDRIRLLSFEVVDSLSPGAEFDVTLYWEARQPPEDDYIVFVHLLDADGQLAASHDGPPMGGRYPTSAWLPGDVVPDTHHLVLDPDVPAGAYRLQAGMYAWPSLERLPIGDDKGVGVVVLQTLRVFRNLPENGVFWPIFPR